MPRNEEGEFELVLGNRQLLSVFFIVVVLLGVFFVMGYILGKNSSPVASDVASVRKPVDSSPAPNPIIIDKSTSKSSAAGDPVVEKRIVPEKPVEKPVEKALPRMPDPKIPEPKAPEPKKASPKPTAEPLPASSSAKTGVPPKGSLFLQVGAVGRAEADVVAKVLRGKGHNLWIAPTDKDNIFRVLVGPIQKSEQGKTRGDLEGLGFKPFPRTY